MYCQHCGGEMTPEQIAAAAAAANPAAAAASDEVEIARIQAERDIQVAKIGARTEGDYNDTRVAVAEIEGAAEVGAAEATAEAVAAVVDAQAPDDELAEPAEPAVIEVPAEPPADELAPPEVDHAGGGGESKKPAWVF